MGDQSQNARRFGPRTSSAAPGAAVNAAAPEIQNPTTDTALSSMNSSVSSLASLGNGEASNQEGQSSAKPSPASGVQAAGSPASHQATPSNLASPANISGLICNIHQTTGNRPHGMIGTTSTISGDKLYVFGGRRLSGSNPEVSSSLYELDLIQRHWTKVEAKGSIPPPRYFHTVCALGDTKLVCHGGMTPVQRNANQPSESRSHTDSGLIVLSDVYVYDILSQTWTAVSTKSGPTGRYAHCATILPSSSVWTSTSAPHSAIHHNPSSSPNKGSLGVSIDGSGGAEMIVVGGQDNANKYIEQISVFNLRSLTWTNHTPLGRAYGAYRSVVTPLTSMKASEVGIDASDQEEEIEDDTAVHGTPMLIYSNYNFLDVKIDLHIRLPNGSLVGRDVQGNPSPPGLRFPTGGIINDHFVVSGIFLTSTKREYTVWALDLRTLVWQRIDTGAAVFSAGSWNRGILWRRRNAFVVLGDRHRNLVDDYNNRRVNFANMCVVELEAFGLYDNPLALSPCSGLRSASAPSPSDPPSTRSHLPSHNTSAAAEHLGTVVASLREFADMDLLAIGGERIPINSHLFARRWGPYFTTLLQDSAATNDSNNTASKFNPARPRLLYLPHAAPTLRALTYYLYTSRLPSPAACSPQTLCSLLQLARPYRVSGLLEATVERLHQTLDGRNTAAVFNAAAMACGGGEALAEELGSGTSRDVSTPVPPRVAGSTPKAARKQTGAEDEDDSSASSDDDYDSDDAEQAVWTGGLSAVVGLQKRGLRGLMEGRRLRERLLHSGRREGGGSGGAAEGTGPSVGLGIA